MSTDPEKILGEHSVLEGEGVVQTANTDYQPSEKLPVLRTNERAAYSYYCSLK